MWTTAQGERYEDCTNDCTAMCTTAQGERYEDCINDCTAMCGLQLKERKMGIVQMIVLQCVDYSSRKERCGLYE